MADLIPSEGETIDIDALAVRAAKGDPDADDDGQPDAGTQPDASAPAGGDEQKVDSDRTVPEKAYARLYGESKAKDRALAERDAEIARLRAQGQAPSAAPAAQGNLRPEVKFIQENIVQPAVKAALAPFEAKAQVDAGRTKLADFWTANPDYVGFRSKLDAVFMAAVSEGNKPEDINPELILNALIGEATRTQVQARRSLAEASQAKQTKINEAAGSTTTGHRPSAGTGGAVGQGPTGGKKKFTEMSAAEIEKEHGNAVIWRRGLHDDVDA